MSSANFRLETFRPWNPSQDKAHPPRDSPGIHRYPSPILIAATPPSSNPSDPASQSPKVHSNKSERHPLPARSPVEVCLDGGLHSVCHCKLQDNLLECSERYQKGSGDLAIWLDPSPSLLPSSPQPLSSSASFKMKTALLL